ncbi:hypothetical protein L1049_012099 [Liquidambar formosana]|uniref:Uncharacterized protein n=1 Tax=Liquidambar formosana TaxID=63359 RepID=A0AAP0RSG0_LIQFO
MNCGGGNNEVGSMEKCNSQLVGRGVEQSGNVEGGSNKLLNLVGSGLGPNNGYGARGDSEYIFGPASDGGMAVVQSSFEFGGSLGKDKSQDGAAQVQLSEHSRRRVSDSSVSGKGMVEVVPDSFVETVDPVDIEGAAEVSTAGDLFWVKAKSIVYSLEEFRSNVKAVKGYQGLSGG